MKSFLVKFGALVAITVFILIFDVFLAADGVPGNTWSELLRDAGMRHWWIPMAWGFLASHFWWNGDYPQWHDMWMLWALGVGSLLLNIITAVVMFNHGLVVPVWFNVVMFSGVGPVLGRLFWPQKRKPRRRVTRFP